MVEVNEGEMEQGKALGCPDARLFSVARDLFQHHVTVTVPPRAPPCPRLPPFRRHLDGSIFS